MRLLNCHFCNKPVHRHDGWLEIYSQLPNGRLTYPCHGDVVALFAHTECGPGCGYAIQLTRLHDEDWDAHLRQKTWWEPAIQSALDEARRVRP
jgi:hypothetical protein